VELNDVSRPFFEQTAKVEMPSLATAMRAIAKDPKDTAAARVISTDPRYASMLRTSCVATRLAGGHADNALPQTATANVNCRVAPTSTGAQVLAVLQKISGDSVKITMRGGDRNNAGGPPAPINPTLLNATTQLTNKMFGGVPVIPTMSTGATDGRFLRAAGIPTYGVSGVFSAPGETNAHGRDEKLRIKSFYDGLDFLYQLVKMISAAKPIS
jgi:acetylornithine deacetylase/succinyl-diaminopimelate desuccinylase-like protein